MNIAKSIAGLVFAFAGLAHAEVITLGSAVGQGGSRMYYNVPNDSGSRVNVEINAVQNFGKVTVGGLSCTGYLTGPFTCSDGGTATVALFEQYLRHCTAGRCNAHWQLNGGSIERP